jgi:hypothetical protein
MGLFKGQLESLTANLQRFPAGHCQMHMTRKLLITLSCGALLLGGCREYAYYQSPFHGNTSSYKVMPAGTDKPVSEIHASGTLVTGGSGDKLRDGQWGLNGSLYRSHSVGILRGFYGVTGALGAYRVRPIRGNDIYDPEKYYPNDSLINARSGSKFYGGVGGTAGLYITTRFKQGGEWRVVGMELNYLKEFGHYLSFREKLPDSAANMLSKSSNFFNIGFHTDINVPTKRGFAGVKLGGVFSTKNLTQYSYGGVPTSVVPAYYSMTVHVTRDRTTGYWQGNFGTYMLNTMFGISYRID